MPLASMSPEKTIAQQGAQVARPDCAPLLERCFLFDAQESSYDITGIAGKIPAWLRGSYYINGPARFERGAFRYQHWLDGDGMVCALHFTEEGVSFHNRFVRTRKLCAEEQAAKPVYRTFGTGFAGDQLRLKVMLESPVNVSVYPYAGKVLAFGEQTLPIELNPVTLETVGEYDFHQRLNEVSPFAAHAKFDPASGHMFNFGVHYAAARPCLQIYEFDEDGNLLSRRRQPVTHAHSVHDFNVTKSNYVFFLSPLFLNVERLVRDRSSVFDALEWRPEAGSNVTVVPREASGAAFSVELGAGYCLHLIHSFEQGGRLAVDVIELEEPVYPQYRPMPDLFVTAPAGGPVRYWIDLASQTVVDRIAMQYDRTPDFPSIDNRLFGEPYENYWMLGISAAGQPGRKFFDQLARGSWREGSVTDIYETPAGEYLCGEPIFIPNPHEQDEGVVIVEHFKPRANAADFLLFDASRLKSGPMARLPLKQPVHPGFHASFQASN